jgi:hypothetical protein
VRKSDENHVLVAFFINPRYIEKNNNNVGLADPFELYKLDVQKIIELPIVTSGKRSELSD